MAIKKVSRIGFLPRTSHTYQKDKICKILYWVSDVHEEKFYLPRFA